MDLAVFSAYCLIAGALLGAASDHIAVEYMVFFGGMIPGLWAAWISHGFIQLARLVAFSGPLFIAAFLIIRTILIAFKSKDKRIQCEPISTLATYALPLALSADLFGLLCGTVLFYSIRLGHWIAR